MELKITADLERVLISLETDANFEELMQILENRAGFLAAWACMPSGITPEQRTWTQGRVQELSDLLRAWNARRVVRDDPPEKEKEF